MVTGERGKAMITSSSNPQLKYVQQLAKKARTRREDGVFLVEGPRMFYEAPKTQIKKSYLSERFYNSMEDSSVLEGTDWELVEDSVFDKMSATMTPQGVLCVLRQPSYRMEDLLKKEKPLLVFLEESAGSRKYGNNLSYCRGCRCRRHHHDGGLCGYL